MKDYLTKAVEFDRVYDRDYNQRVLAVARLMHGAMGLQTEAAEITDILKRHINYGTKLDANHIKEELGDLAWYMAIILDELGSSFDEVMKMNYNKLATRYHGGFTETKAVERNEAAEQNAMAVESYCSLTSDTTSSDDDYFDEEN